MSSNWFDDLVGGVGDFISGTGNVLTDVAKGIFGDNVDLGALAGLIGSAAYKSGGIDPLLDMLGLDFLESDANAPRPTGYQGSIPQYQAVQERVPQTGIATPKPGASGQRYFSDVVYAQRPETPAPTVEQARRQTQSQAQQLAAQNPVVRTMAAGGLASLGGKGYYLGGPTDGMADKVPARIDGRQEARLSDGEFVVPADVVSHLGNGNSNAGAQQLYAMMDKVRQERTGRKEQGKQINPKRFMPGMGA